jgi:regulator of protease activity HflC (stomatin/prohibitin superfamily)
MKQRNRREAEELIPFFGKLILVGIVFLIVVFNFPFYVVGAGERAVEFSKISGVKMESYKEGWHFKIPLIETVHKFSVRVVKGTMSASAASKDLQIVQTEIALNYHLQPDTVPRLYQEVGKDYEGRIIAPAIQEAVKAVTARFTAEELITQRPEVSRQIQAILEERLSGFYIVVDKMSIVNFDFSESFNAAIEAKQEAEQLALKAQRDLERVKLEAQQQLAVKEAEAAALRMQKEAITPNLIELRRVEMQREWVQKWNGVMPHYMLTMDGGNTPNILMNLPTTGGE